MLTFKTKSKPCHKDVGGQCRYSYSILNPGTRLEVSSQVHLPACIAPGEITPGTNQIGGWVVPRTSLNAVE
jgi:hypothetical protein